MHVTDVHKVRACSFSIISIFIIIINKLLLVRVVKYLLNGSTAAGSIGRFYVCLFFILTVCKRTIPLALLGNTVVSLRRCGFEQTPGLMNNIKDKLVHARRMLMPLCNMPGAQKAA
jgi:hypothetical protein